MKEIKDKNGKIIKHGDIVREYLDAQIIDTKVAIMTEYGLMGVSNYGKLDERIEDFLIEDLTYEIIGEVHKNPELAKGIEVTVIDANGNEQII